MKTCSKCGFVGESDLFREGRRTCKKCHNKARAKEITSWRRRTKGKIIASLGGKCSTCGYDKCSAALHAHHINKDKEFNISDSLSHPKSWSKIQSELDKCILLCANCHTEVHYSIV